MTPPAFGPLLTRLRQARGWSQHLLAARLCAASGTPTVTRHEISRWERQQRLPAEFWLGWLATVLDVPVARLAAARAARSRTDGRPAGRQAAAPGPGPHVPDLRRDLLSLAQRWLADPAGPPITPAPLLTPGPAGTVPAGLAASDQLDELTGADLARLRRLDDLVGGSDLAHHGAHRLWLAGTALGRVGRDGRRRLLPLVAEAGQLAGWQAADAGDRVGALTAYRYGLVAAAAAGDRGLAGHVLGSASHLFAADGDPRGALLLARAGQAGARRVASAGLRALLLHRVAFAAALAGRRDAAEVALARARQAAERYRPDREPPWLYWLDDAELTAMSGRSQAALGRPLRAEPLLRAGLRPDRARSSAIYGAWLSRTYVDLGEVEQASAVADRVLLDTVRSGSARAAAALTGVRHRLAGHRAVPAVRRFLDRATAARPYLPDTVGTPAG